jgi:hypothetical protein
LLRPYASIYRNAYGVLQAYIDEMARLADENGDHVRLNEVGLEQIRQDLGIIVAHGAYVGLLQTVQAAAEARSQLVSDISVDRIRDLILYVSNTLRHELPHKEFLYVDPSVASLYQAPLKGWEVAVAKIDDIEFDVIEAGKCLALARSTACVFHLMRVAEIGLRHLARRLRVKLPKTSILLAEWQALLQGMDSRLATLRNLPKARRGRDEMITYYSQLRLEFTAIRDVWRNHVSHARECYDAREALRAYDHVQLLMRRLAEGRSK